MKRLLLLIAVGLFSVTAYAQVAVNADNSQPDPSAGLDVKFTNRGILPPRMTNAALGAIANPANGLMVYCIDCGPSGTGAMMMFTNGNWMAFDVSCIPRPVGVSVSPSENPACIGDQVTYTATPLNGGSAPIYQWKVNRVSMGTNSPVFSYYPSNEDTVACQLTSNVQCATGNPATSRVYMHLKPFVIVYMSVSDMGCATTLITFTAIAVNAGTNPVYQWRVNGINVGSDSTSYSYIPVNNDVVSCEVTSTIACAATNSYTVTVVPIPMAPAEGTHVPSANQVVWNWSPVPDAAGYLWNTTNNYYTATDLGAATSQTETGLTCNTPYASYVWAYNFCGNSAALAMNQTTSACPVFTCGSSVTISHMAGGVAPVSKTVTYGTVTNIPGEPAKCWITSNLGADHQATAVNDATEVSAGWYWQFNRKQGYKHDGINRIPNTIWISSISENSDWITANDPCNIELGSSWRIPTYTEWYNVDNTGGWTTWTGPWNSGLKLHAAGGVVYSDGSLYGRGEYGEYWSSTEEGSITAFYLIFYNVDCYMESFGGYKWYGFSARCIKDN